MVVRELAKDMSKVTCKISNCSRLHEVGSTETFLLKTVQNPYNKLKPNPCMR